MSATNRGEERVEFDAYNTPEWLIDAVLPFALPKTWSDPKKEFSVLEPACGLGAIVKRIEAAKCPAPLVIDSLDIQDLGYGRVGDFLEEEPEPIFDLVITNPPYSLAKEFVDHGKKFLRDEKSKLILLLRINFFGAQYRAEWWRENPISGLYVTPRRPSFKKTGKSSSDATEYAWFQWGGGPPLPIVLLETELERYKTSSVRAAC